MKRTAGRLSCAAFLIALPAAAWAAEISVDSTTMLRIEKSDDGSQKNTILPATQFLALDAKKLADGNLSLHFYGWGRADLADQSFNDDKASGKLTYAYLRYRFNQANADVRAGRLFVHEGVTNEQVDGLAVRTDLPYGFGISGFGGAPVHTAHIFGENTDGKGNGIAGGRLNYRYGGRFELGLSGVYESKAPTLLTHASANHRLVGGDVWFSPHRVVEVVGHSSYNTEVKHFAEHSYQVNLKPVQPLVLTAEYNEQNDRSYQYAWTMFSGAALNPADLSRSFGLLASYRLTKAVDLAADYKHYRREVREPGGPDGNADRFGGNAKFSFLDNMARAGLGYHYLRANAGFAIPPNTSGSYHELRGYAMHDTKRFFGALDIIDYIFQEKVFNEKMAWEGIASVGYHITPDLAVTGDISYGRNPQFSEETRGVIRLTYNTTFTGGKK